MNNLRTSLASILTVALASLASTDAVAQVDIATLLSNAGFENGNLSSWTLSQPNATYVTSLSPAVNPSIDPADAVNDPTTLFAPAGSNFTGLKDGSTDAKYKLNHSAVSGTFAIGTSYKVTVWANRGRLEPFDTPASTADALVKIFGWSAGTLPTVTPATDNWSRTITWNPAAQSFSPFASDGAWQAQTFVFGPTPVALGYLTVSITGRNNNHDQYIALDIQEPGVAVEPGTWSSIKHLYR